MINLKRLKKEFNEISKFGALDSGGITRLAYSEDIIKARNFIIDKMKKIGMEIFIDPIGNLRGRLNGSSQLPPVVIGSHLDSVPEGGAYDGTIGVMVGLEIIRSIYEQKIEHNRPLELIIFPCEESSRFGMATVGSKALAGKISLDEIKKLSDEKGVSIYEAAKNCGFNPDLIKHAKLNKGDIFSYIELHIEQGPILYEKRVPVGIVTGIAAPIRYKLTIFGRADHSGATPMYMRKDALACASEIILGIEDVALNKAGKSTVATVGLVTAKPGVLNVIPGEVSLGIGIRDVVKKDLIKADLLIKNLIKNICKKRDLSYELSIISKDEPIILSEKMIEILENEANNLKIDYIKLPSGAGHDAMHMIDVADMTGMIFIPCEKGISHNILEKANFDDIEKGAILIKNILVYLSNII